MEVTDSHGSDCVPREIIHSPLLREVININEVHADFAIVTRGCNAIAPKIHACSHCCLKQLLMRAEQRMQGQTHDTVHDSMFTEKNDFSRCADEPFSVFIALCCECHRLVERKFLYGTGDRSAL